MTLFTRFPLRLTIPLFLLLLALLAEGYTMWYSRARTDADEEKRLLEQVARTMIELQASVNYRLRKEDLEGAQSAIAIRGANPAIDVIALVDDTGAIIGSTKLKIVGIPASMALPEADTANMRKAGMTLTGSVVISDDRMILTAYYPAILGVRAGEIRPRRIGTLYLRYNMAAAKAMRRRDLERHTLVVAGFYAGCFLVLGLFLHAVLTRRVNRLVAASERFTAGDLSIRAGIKGNDELARIGGAFDSMVRRILSEQESLRRSEERYRMLFENSPLSIWEEDFSGVKALFDDLRREGVVDLEAYLTQYPETVRQCAELVRIIDMNRAALELHGAASKKELLAGLLDTFTPESFETFRQELVCLWNGGMGMTRDAVVRTLEGESRHVIVSFSVCPGHEATFSKVLVSIVDITKRKRVEEALRDSESRLNEAQRIAHIGSWELDLVTNTLSWTDEIFRIFEIDPERFGASYEAFLGSIHPDDREMVDKAYTGSLRDRTPYEIVHRLLMADGRIKYVRERCETSFEPDGNPLRSLGTVQDVTEHIQAEAALRRNADMIHDLYNHAPCGYHSLDKDGVIVQINDTELDWLGFARDEILGKVRFVELVTEDSKQTFREKFPIFLKQGWISDLEFDVVRKDGTILPVLLSATAVYDEVGHFLMSRSSLFDITERKQSEEKLRRLNRELRAISNCNQVLVRAVDEQSLINEICRIICEDAGYRMAWVGYAENDDARTIRPAAWAGVEDGYLKQAAITWAETEHGCGPSGTAIRTGQSVSSQDFSSDASVSVWRKAALERGYRSSIALPLKDEEQKSFGVLNIYSTEPNAFTADETRLLEELSDDLSFGINVLRARIARERDQWSLALMSFALENVSESAFLIDEDARLLYVNRGSCRKLGYEHEELLALSVKDVDPDFPMERWPAHWAELKTNRSLTFEGRHRAKDGRMIPVEINANYFEYDGSGYNLALVRDITERKRVESERQANLRFFESMDRVNRAIQGASDIKGMMKDLLDTVLSIFDCDRAFLLYPCDPDTDTWSVPMECTKPEYPGVLALGLVMPIDAEVAETFRVLLASDGPVKFGPGTEYPLPVEVSKQFGFKSFMSMALYPKFGKPWQFGLHQCSCARVWTEEDERLMEEIGIRLADALTVWRMFEELKDSEGKLSEAQRIAHIGYWDRDISGGRIMLSDESCRIFGLPDERLDLDLEEWHPMWLKLIHSEDRDAVAQVYESSLKGEATYNVEYRIVRPDGTVRFIHSQANMTRDDSGRVVRVLGMMQDITERKQHEDKVIKALKEKEVLLAEVHHRVKNNMAVISSLMNMQSTYIKDKEDLEMFRECQSRIMSMALVHEKLYKTRDFSNINIREYLVALSSGVQNTFSTGRTVKVSVEAEDVNINIDILIPCGLIINELLTNSFKHAFIDITDPRITIALESQDENYLLTIADNGIGLPEGFDITQSEGLGFKLVTALCQQIKGTLSYERDGGARFRLSFPGTMKFARGE